MKKIIAFLTLLVGLITLSFGQSDSIVQDSICFSIGENKVIVKQLLEGDECKEHLKEYKSEIINLKFTTERQNEKIFEMEANKARYIAINAESAAQVDLLKSELEKAERKLRRKNFMIGLTGAGGVVAFVWALIR